MLSKRYQALVGSLYADSGNTCHARFKELTLTSHFQPIFSLSHSRVVGHEGLLRGRDPQGGSVSPLTLFSQCTGDEAGWCDALSRGLHLANFAAQDHGDQWLFLNILPEALLTLTQEEGGKHLRAVVHTLPVPPSHVVLELLESAIPDGEAFLKAVQQVREQGFLVALDDFGAGHSNFDRVWSIRPDIVKLDRSLIASFGQDRRRQRVVTQIASLLHESGSLVLMEGIETEEEAMLALEADVDFVQGYYFCRPQPTLLPRGPVNAILELHGQLAQFRDGQRARRKAIIAPYLNAIGQAGLLLGAGRPLQQACSAFLELPGAEVCFVLDEHGCQVGPNVWSEQGRRFAGEGFHQLADSSGACWARRPYFKRAMHAPGRVQATRPYRTLNGKGMTVTVSYAFQHRDAAGSSWRVVCGDVTWHEDGAGPSALPPLQAFEATAPGEVPMGAVPTGAWPLER